MAESAVDKTPATTSILTEEMIDAAMSKRLRLLEDGKSPNYIKRGRSDHNYCIDGDDDDGDESSSDGSDVSIAVIDGDSIQDITSKVTLCSSNSNSHSNVKITELNDEVLDANQKQDKEGSSVILCEKDKEVGKNLSTSTNTLNQNSEVNDHPVISNKKYHEADISKNANIVLITSSDNTINSDNPELFHQTIESKIKSCNLKQGLTVKPISNLLKSDNSVKIFKCVQGKIEMLSGVVKRKSMKDLITGNNQGSNLSDMNTNILSLTNKETIPVKDDLGKRMDLDLPETFLPSRINIESIINISQDNGVSSNKDCNNEITSANQSKEGTETVSSTCTIDLTTFPKADNCEIAETLHDNTLTKLNSQLPLLKKPVQAVPVVTINENVIAVGSEKSVGSSLSLDCISKNISEKNESVSTSSVTDQNTGNKNLKISGTFSNAVLIAKNSKPFVQRRQILPKINYRYHTKDKLIMSDTLPKNDTTGIGKKANDNGYILPDKSNSRPVIIMPTESATPKINSNQELNSVPVSLKCMVNKTSTSTCEIQSGMKSVCSNQPVFMKDKCVGKTWEKVDRYTLNDESNQQKLEECTINSLKAQLLEREVPLYKPPDCSKFYSCLDCSDRFVLESSLREHRFRKSVLIKYWCRTCSCLLNMYNRCMFLAHIRSHGQLIKNIDMSSLSIEPLPKSLIKLGSNDDGHSDCSPCSSSSVGSQPVISSSSVVISVNSMGKNSSKQSTSTSTIRKPITSVDVNSLNGSNKPFYRRAIKTVSKLVPSNINLEKNTGIQKESVINVNCHDNEEDDVDDDSENDDDDENDNDNNNDDNEEEIEIYNSINEEGNNILQVEVEPDCIIKRENISYEKNDSTADMKKAEEISVLNPTQNICESNGFINDNTELAGNDVADDQTKSDQQSEPLNKSKSVKGKRKCPECDIPITARLSLRKHLQNGNKPGDPGLKCNVCRLILPTNCALKMHLRIHMKLKPFRCPECAIEFHIFSRFLMHLKYTCCHLTKCVRYVCTLCGVMQPSLTILEQHLLSRHVRPIFKCSLCPVAFVTLKSIDKHKEKAHPGTVALTTCYQQCKLCPEKLIPKKKFLNHLKGHISDDRLCIYAYQCPSCKNTFYQRTELIYHRMQCDTRDGIIKSILYSPPASPPLAADGSTRDILPDTNDEKEVVLPCKKKKLVNDDEIEIVEEEQDPLSLEGFQAHEEPLREPQVELCVVCKKEKVVILPGENKSSQSLCCKKCVRPFGTTDSMEAMNDSAERKNKLQAARLKSFKCKICNSTNSMDIKAIYKHFKTYHKELEGQCIDEWVIIENKVQKLKRSNAIATAETIKEKYNKKRKVAPTLSDQSVIEVKDEPGEDKESDNNIEKKKSKRYVKPKQKVSEVKSFESGQIITTDDAKSDLNCSKCDFVGSNKEELRDHVTCHRIDPNALQCLECGECFVVLPSLEKHLIINHRISNIDSYISDNKQYIFGIDTKNDDEIEADEDQKDSANFKCKVCQEGFESKTALDKHFRSHGMAFLFKSMSN